MIRARTQWKKAHRRVAESFLLKQPTVGIAGRLVFGF